MNGGIQNIFELRTSKLYRGEISQARIVTLVRKLQFVKLFWSVEIINCILFVGGGDEFVEVVVEMSCNLSLAQQQNNF